MQNRTNIEGGALRPPSSFEEDAEWHILNGQEKSARPAQPGQ